ncbi:replication initiator protein A [Mycoplasma enhydrae]|uniref:replication initiator protein A n=1 Tax=Mycoplasma enhydrae TaxID=2499220 RepID=UPI00197B94BD|nr:replication initiator protein A [Mycoplasma enhydrae]MBN4089707.1 replication initiator protein A [Mycoplasma enhydrae]
MRNRGEKFKNCIVPRDKATTTFTILSDIIYLIFIGTKNAKLFGIYITLWKRFSKSLKTFRFDDDNGVFIYYPTKELAQNLNISEISIKRRLQELKNLKIIVTDRENIGSKQKIYFNNLLYVWNEHMKSDEFRKNINNLKDADDLWKLTSHLEAQATKKPSLEDGLSW